MSMIKKTLDVKLIVKLNLDLQHFDSQTLYTNVQDAAQNVII